MLSIKRFSFTLAMALIAILLGSVEAQTPRINTINITAESDRVHVAAQGDVTEMRLEVAGESGDVIFESGAISGNTLDWNMRDASGERVAAGTYLFTVTFRPATGKPRKRVEQVTIAEEEKSGTEKAKTTAPEAVQATIDGAGTAGRIAKFTDVDTIGNSVITESAGKVGIGTAAPNHTLSIIGGPVWTSNSWRGALELSNASAIGWQANSAGQRFGIGHTNGGLYLFRTNSNPGTTASAANYDMVITDGGKVGIGTVNPTAKLHVASTGDAIHGSAGTSTALGGVGVTGTGRTGVSGTGGIGVSGFSSIAGGIGVAGESATGMGVRGISGAAHTLTNPGVYGKSTGDGGIGVIGEANNGNAWGVYGTSMSPTGYGVYAKNLSGGFAMGAEGNVTQNRDKGGWVKAMAQIGGTDNGGQIFRCFNALNNTSAVNNTTDTACGIHVSHSDNDDYVVDFGFQVDDRFVIVTPSDVPAISVVDGGRSASVFLRSATARVSIQDANGDTVNNNFFIIIF